MTSSDFTADELNHLQAGLSVVLAVHEGRSADAWGLLNTLDAEEQVNVLKAVVGIAAGFAAKFCDVFEMDTAQYLDDAIYAADPSNA